MSRATNLTIEHRGMFWSGHYSVQGEGAKRTIVVESDHGTLRARSRREADTEKIAAMVFRQLIDEWLARSGRRLSDKQRDELSRRRPMRLD